MIRKKSEADTNIQRFFRSTKNKIIAIIETEIEKEDESSKTTEIYTHIMNKPNKNINNPLDKLIEKYNFTDNNNNTGKN